MSEKHDFSTFKLPLTRENVSFYQHTGGFSSKNKRKYPERKKFVKKTLNTLTEIIEPTCLSTLLINPELIYRIPSSKDNKLDLKDLEGPCNFTILSTDNKGSVIVYSNREDPSKFKDRLKEYSKKSGNKLDIYDKINVPEHISPRERIGSSIKNQPLNQDLEQVDIYLWYFGYNNHSLLELFMQNIMKEIKKMDGVVQNHEIILEFPIIQAKINYKILKKLSMEPTIRIIERRIKFLPDKSKFNIDLREPVYKEPISNLGLLVLDESILSGHPLISKSIKEYDIDVDTDDISIDHGTAVASLILYGDLANIITKHHQIFVPIGKLYFNSVDFENISLEKIRNKIIYYIDNYPNIKLINISLIADEMLDINSYKQLPIAAVIDNIIYKYCQEDREIIFVICTGNYFGYDKNRILRNTFIRNFNSVIHEFKNNKIKDPAVSSLAITVGSLNSGKNYAGIDLIENFLSKKYYPSLFTRVGPGVEESIKPDFVDFGSDVIKLSSSSIDERKTGIIVPIISQYGEIGFDIGSSFSTPVFGNKIARLWALYPKLTQNSIKCLLAIGAEIKEEMLEFLDIDEKLKNLKIDDLKKVYNLFGYGFLHLDEIIYSNKNFVVLLRERKSKVNNYDLYDIIIPDEFFTVSGKKELVIALSYTPPTKQTRQDYLGVNIDFQLISGVPEELINKYYDVLQKSEFNEELESSLEELYPELSDIEFDFENFDEKDDKQVKFFSNEISKDQEKTISCLNNKNISNRIKTKVLGKFISRNKWNSKIIPTKSLTKYNTLRTHRIKWTRSVPQSKPNEHGLKLLIYSKFSKSKWFKSELKRYNELENYQFKYSVAVSIKTELDIDLRAKIREKIQIRPRIRL